MCGRYLLRNAPEDASHVPWSQYWRDISVFIPRYNICPAQEAAVLRRRGGKIQCEQLSWGFKPSWSKYQPLINTRAESLLSSRMFADAARQRRCLIVADGFYEPKGSQGARQRPWYLFEYEDGRSFGFAGIWTEGGFSIITCDANQQVSPIHDRMPVILEADTAERWLASKLDDAEIMAMLAPRDYPGLRARQVSDYAKKPTNEGPQCVAAV